MQGQAAFGYVAGMASVGAKRKVSLSLDEDLVAAFEREGPLSTQVNAALRAEWERRRRPEALSELLGQLEAEVGALDSDEDEAAIARYIDLLS